MKITICAVTIAVLAGGFTACSYAQSYPSKPIRMVVPFPPGGGADAIGRWLTQKMSESLGQQVVVDNRGGAGGNIGMEHVANSAPDGYTIALAHTSQYAINPSLYPKLPYDPVKDFAPITLLANTFYVMAVHPSVPAKSVKEFIALAKSRRSQLTYSSPGHGSMTHLAAELLRRSAGVEMLHVPYKGGGPALLDLVAGQVHVTILTYNTLSSSLKSGKLRALGVTTLERAPVLPEVPAIAETVPGYRADVWYGVVAAAGTPRDIIARLNQEILRALKAPEVRQRFAQVALQPIGSAPAQLGDHIKSEIAKWAVIVKGLGAKID